MDEFGLLVPFYSRGFWAPRPALPLEQLARARKLLYSLSDHPIGVTQRYLWSGGARGKVGDRRRLMESCWAGREMVR